MIDAEVRMTTPKIVLSTTVMPVLIESFCLYDTRLDLSKYRAFQGSFRYLLYVKSRKAAPMDSWKKLYKSRPR